MFPLSLLARVVPFLAALIVATDRKIVRRLRQAGATSEAAAVPLPLGGPVAPVRLRRLVSVGAIGRAGARYYLDERGFAAWRRVRRRRVVVVLAVVLALVGALRLTGVFG